MVRTKVAKERLNNAMALRHFYIVETLLKNYAQEGNKPVSAQNMIDRLTGDGAWEFFKDISGKMNSPDLLEDIAYLHQRGFAYVKGDYSVISTLEKSRDKKNISPTYISNRIFMKVYQKNPNKINWKRRKVKRIV